MKLELSRSKVFSIAASLYVLLFLVVENVLFCPFYPWVIFCVPAFIIWPTAVCYPRSIIKKSVSFVLYALIVLYYGAANLLLSPGHPWVLYIAFGLAWYPFSLVFAKKGALGFSIYGIVWGVLFFGVVNLITTPTIIWAVYPIFAMLWWPLAVYFFGGGRKF